MHRRVTATAIGIAMIVAACGDDDSGDAGDTTQTDVADEATDDTSGTGGSDSPGTSAGTGGSDSAGTPTGGGAVSFADTVSPSRFDPHRSTIGQDIRFLAPVYDRLVHLDPDGNFIPGLATDWEFNNDGTELTFELREGVTFHDGEPFNAQAVKANLERGQNLDDSSIADEIADIEQIEAADTHTVVLTLSEPNAILPGVLSHRAGSIVSPEAFDNPDLDQAPVGAGMYEVTNYVIDDRIVYERYDDYWDDEVEGPDRIELRIMSEDSARLNALRSGEVDIARITGPQIDQAESAGFQITSEPGLAYLVLYLNRDRSEFDDPLVRQALNHAINREAIIEAVLNGAGEPTTQPFPEGYFSYNDEYPGDYYEYDPDRARELLAEAGVDDGFEFEALVPSLDWYVQTGEVVQASLAELGITMNLRQIESSATADLWYAQEEGDALVAQFAGRPDPQMTLDMQFSDTGFGNPGKHSTDEFLDLNDQAKAAVDEDERNGLLQDAVGEVVEDAFQAPIAHDHGVFAYNDTITNFEMLVTGQPNFRVMGVDAG